MLRSKLLSLLMLLSNVVFGQGYHTKFESLFSQKDTAGARRLLAEWEKSNPDDPELYKAAFNFYYYKCKEPIASLSKEKKGNMSLQLTDSTGKVAGYMNNDVEYRPDQSALAFGYIDKGIEKFPDRLDMRFGKCYVLGQMGDYEGFTREVIRTVEYSTTNKNRWLWTDNKKLDDGEKFMLKAVQDYLRQLYDTQNDSLLENMKRIGVATINYYPANVEILSSTAVAETLTKQYAAALGHLKQAEKINPTDFIVLNNIASAYKMSGDTTDAIKYYELTEKYGDTEAKEQARKSIKELRKATGHGK